MPNASHGMNKRGILVIILALVVVVILGGAYIYKQKKEEFTLSLPTHTRVLVERSSHQQNATGSAPVVRDCDAGDLSGALSLQGALGNVYGQVTLTNASGSPCIISAKDFVQASYNSSKIKNITIAPQDVSTSGAYLLTPGKAAYAQVHYPNGPQCSSKLDMEDISFYYQLPNGKKVMFKDSDKKVDFTIPVCDSSSEITEIDVTNFSDTPVTN